MTAIGEIELKIDRNLKINIA